MLGFLNNIQIVAAKLKDIKEEKINKVYSYKLSKNTYPS